MSEKKTTLLSPRNQNWRTVKSKTEKVIDLLTNISTNKITELNDFINAGPKLVCEKSWFLWRPQTVKTRMGNQIRIADKKTTTSKNIKQNMKIYSNETEKVQQKRQVQLEETNQKIMVKEGRLKRYRDRTKPYKQNWKTLPTSRGRMGEDIPDTGCKRGQNILEQNLGTKRYF